MVDRTISLEPVPADADEIKIKLPEQWRLDAVGNVTGAKISASTGVFHGGSGGSIGAPMKPVDYMKKGEQISPHQIVNANDIMLTTPGGVVLNLGDLVARVMRMEGQVNMVPVPNAAIAAQTIEQLQKENQALNERVRKLEEMIKDIPTTGPVAW